jgi:hypothetical protein
LDDWLVPLRYMSQIEPAPKMFFCLVYRQNQLENYHRNSVLQIH